MNVLELHLRRLCTVLPRRKKFVLNIDNISAGTTEQVKQHAHRAMMRAFLVVINQKIFMCQYGYHCIGFSSNQRKYSVALKSWKNAEKYCYIYLSVALQTGCKIYKFKLKWPIEATLCVNFSNRVVMRVPFIFTIPNTVKRIQYIAAENKERRHAKMYWSLWWKRLFQKFY